MKKEIVTFVDENENKEEVIEQVFDYIRFGSAGYFVYNDENDRKIERKYDRIDTLFTDCNCFEGSRFVGVRSGREAAEWLMR